MSSTSSPETGLTTAYCPVRNIQLIWSLLLPILQCRANKQTNLNLAPTHPLPLIPCNHIAACFYKYNPTSNRSDTLARKLIQSSATSLYPSRALTQNEDVVSHVALIAFFFSTAAVSASARTVSVRWPIHLQGTQFSLYSNRILFVPLNTLKSIEFS